MPHKENRTTISDDIKDTGSSALKCLIVGDHPLPHNMLQTWLIDRLTPLEIEIGSGQGNFLCRIARYKNDTRFIGIDLNQERCKVAAQRAQSLRLSNVYIVNLEAHEFVANSVYSETIRAVHIYFPTPYPEAIGLSKRLVCREFLEEIYRILIPGGLLRIATDHKEYFDKMWDLFRRKPWWNTEWVPPLPIDGRKGLVIDTPCEIKYSSEYRIFELQMMK